MSTLRANSLKPITSGNSLVLQGDSGGSGVSGPSIDSNGDVDFSQNTNAKIKLPSSGGIYESDGSTQVLTESGGSVTIENATFNGTIGSSANGFTGVKIADQWRLTTGFTGNKDPIDSNLERVDTTGQGTIGSAMTESSGVFTFPLTGIYYVEFVQSLLLNGDSAYVAGYIRSNISSTRDVLTRNYSFTTSFSGSGNIYTQVVASTLFDCSNVSTHKVEFSSAEKHNSSMQTIGDSTENATYMTFVRLGDT